jgi:predicted negative regulator of RcsB-dependent stress response
MRKITRYTAASIALLTVGLSNANAEDMSKEEVKSKAVEMCQQAAQSRYGENSVLSISKKAKWDNSLKGASVRLKIKPESKRKSNYSCIVYVDKKVTFSKS